jgi:PAS domain S-box-containing protein
MLKGVEKNEGEARFRAVFENAAVGIARVARDGRFLEVNQRLCEILGYTREELMRRTFGDLTHPADLEADLDALRRMLAGVSEVYSREKRYRRKDGATVWVNLTVSMVRKPGDLPDYFVSVVEDISTRKRAEESLHENEERLRTERMQAAEAVRASNEEFRILADTAPVMIWISGTDKLCTFFNKTWLDFSGRSMEKELGNGWTEGVHREDYDRCMNVYVASFESLKSFEMEYRLRRYDGEYRCLLDHGVPRFSPSGRFLGYIGSCIDITERKHAEAERAQLAQEQAARAAAEAASRSKDEFLAMVSHELRSPLNAILGYAWILRTGAADKQDISKAVTVIERNAKAQLQIIEDLFDSARIITGKLSITAVPVDLTPVLDAALDTVRAAAEAKGIILAADFDRRPECVLGDSTRLQQVVWNLLSNAVKFTPDGGFVELKMDSDADYVRLTFRDTGKGIEPGFLPYVFDRFRQADSSSTRRHGGLGLGLAIVKDLVELHGGTITAASEGTGQGATFTVTLPRRRPESITDV